MTAYSHEFDYATMEDLAAMSRPGAPRTADLEEWHLASGGMRFDQCLRLAVAAPRSIVRAFRLNGVCAALWGANPDAGEGEAYIWLVATPAAEGAWRAVQRQFAREITLMHQVAPKLLAVADKRNSLHALWLARVGFKSRPYPDDDRFVLHERTIDPVL